MLNNLYLLPIARGSRHEDDGEMTIGEWKNEKLKGYVVKYHSDSGIFRKGFFVDNFESIKYIFEEDRMKAFIPTCEELGFARETEALTNCTRKLMELVNEETRD